MFPNTCFFFPCYFPVSLVPYFFVQVLENFEKLNKMIEKARAGPLGTTQVPRAYVKALVMLEDSVKVHICTLFIYFTRCFPTFGCCFFFFFSLTRAGPLGGQGRAEEAERRERKGVQHPEAEAEEEQQNVREGDRGVP
jgi:hypothetical protein